MNCNICNLTIGDENTPKNFVLCVLNCSHNYCLECIVTFSTQFGPATNNRASAIINSDRCPLCREIIIDIIPLQSLVTTDEAFESIKQLNLIKTINEATITTKLCRHKSDINKELNDMFRNISPDLFLEKVEAILDFMIVNKLFIICDDQGTFIKNLFEANPIIYDNYPNKCEILFE